MHDMDHLYRAFEYRAQSDIADFIMHGAVLFIKSIM